MDTKIILILCIIIFLLCLLLVKVAIEFYIFIKDVEKFEKRIMLEMKRNFE